MVQVQMDVRAIVGVVIEVIDSARVECAGAADQAMNFIPFAQ
jgi:hypothetical protein